MITPLSAVVVRLADAIGSAGSLGEICHAALDGLRAVTGLERAAILLFDADGVMRFKAWSGLSAAYRQVVEGHTPWVAGDPPPAPIVVSDLRSDQTYRDWQPVFAAEEIAALAFIPVVSQRRVIGKFMLYQREPDRFDRGEVAAALAIAYQIGFAVDRLRTDQAATEARQRLLFALDAAQMGTWAWTIGTNAVEWSENLERIHGLAPGTFTGDFSSYAKEVHPDDRPRVLASLQRALHEGTTHDVEYRIVAPDGVTRWVHGKGRVERDDAGRPVHMSGVCMDIGGRKRAEADVQQALAHEAALRQRLGRLTEGAERLLTFLTPEMVVNEVIDLAESIVKADGYAVWRRRGEEWRIVASRGLSEAFAAEMIRAAGPVNFDSPVVAEDVFVAAGLESRHERYRAEGIASLMSIPLPVRGTAGGSICFYYRVPQHPSEVELHVATALAQLAGAAVSNADLHVEQQRLRHEADEANRVKDEFLATLSHELRTPLNVIVGRARRLLDTDVPPEAVAQAAVTIDRNAQMLTRLVEDLLDVSRFTLGQVTLDMKAIDVGTLVQNVLTSLEPTARSKRILLRHQLPADLPPLTADQTRLQQVIWNLVTNAIKFTPDGGEVTVSTGWSGALIELTVTDTGIGISPEFLPHVFEMFRQGERAGNRQYGGLGLGLSIVRRLIELHGGAVTAASPGLNQGATFTVQLPCADHASVPRAVAGHQALL